jgi:hypothetical protein
VTEYAIRSRRFRRMSYVVTSEFVVDRNYRIPNKDCDALLAVLLGIPIGE